MILVLNVTLSVFSLSASVISAIVVAIVAAVFIIITVLLTVTLICFYRRGRRGWFFCIVTCTLCVINCGITGKRIIQDTGKRIPGDHTNNNSKVF